MARRGYMSTSMKRTRSYCVSAATSTLTIDARSYSFGYRCAGGSRPSCSLTLCSASSASCDGDRFEWTVTMSTDGGTPPSVRSASA